VIPDRATVMDGVKLKSIVASKTPHPNVGGIHLMSSHCSGLDCGESGEVS